MRLTRPWTVTRHYQRDPGGDLGLRRLRREQSARLHRRRDLHRERRRLPDADQDRPEGAGPALFRRDEDEVRPSEGGQCQRVRPPAGPMTRAPRTHAAFHVVLKVPGGEPSPALPQRVARMSEAISGTRGVPIWPPLPVGGGGAAGRSRDRTAGLQRGPASGMNLAAADPVGSSRPQECSSMARAPVSKFYLDCPEAY